MTEHEYYVDADKTRVMQTPKGSTCGNDQRVVALCATDAGGMDVAVRIADMLNGYSTGAPQACRCGPMCEDRHRPGCRRFDVTPTRTALRALVDAVWQHATDSTAVPSTDIADRLITRTIIPSHDGPHLAAIVAEPVAWEYRAFVGDLWTEWKNLGQPIEAFRSGPWRFNLENGTAEVRALGVIAAPTTSPEPIDTDSVSNFGKSLGGLFKPSPEPDAVREALHDRINRAYLLTINAGGPTERHLTAEEFATVLAALSRPAHGEETKRLRAALMKIEKWFGEFPATGQFWDREKTDEMSYSACYGSNGERDYMRGVARDALARHDRQTGGPR